LGQHHNLGHSLFQELHSVGYETYKLTSKAKKERIGVVTRTSKFHKATHVSK
jgi:hypothetical protein